MNATNLNNLGATTSNPASLQPLGLTSSFTSGLTPLGGVLLDATSSLTGQLNVGNALTATSSKNAWKDDSFVLGFAGSAIKPAGYNAASPGPLTLMDVKIYLGRGGISSIHPIIIGMHRLVYFIKLKIH